MFIEWIELKKKWGIGIILRPEQKSTERLKKRFTSRSSGANNPYSSHLDHFGVFFKNVLDF